MNSGLQIHCDPIVISCSVRALLLYNSKLIKGKTVDRKGHKSQASIGEHDHIFKKEQENVECDFASIKLLLPTYPSAEYVVEKYLFWD